MNSVTILLPKKTHHWGQLVSWLFIWALVYCLTYSVSAQNDTTPTLRTLAGRISAEDFFTHYHKGQRSYLSPYWADFHDENNIVFSKASDAASKYYVTLADRCSNGEMKQIVRETSSLYSAAKTHGKQPLSISYKTDKVDVRLDQFASIDIKREHPIVKYEVTHRLYVCISPLNLQQDVLMHVVAILLPTDRREKVNFWYAKIDFDNEITFVDARAVQLEQNSELIWNELVTTDKQGTHLLLRSAEGKPFTELIVKQD